MEQLSGIVENVKQLGKNRAIDILVEDNNKQNVYVISNAGHDFDKTDITHIVGSVVLVEYRLNHNKNKIASKIELVATDGTQTKIYDSLNGVTPVAPKAPESSKPMSQKDYDDSDRDYAKECYFMLKRIEKMLQERK